MDLYSRIKGLREKRAGIVEEAGKLLKLSHTENRDLTPEEDAKFTAIHADADTIKADIDRLEQQRAADASIVERRDAGVGREDRSGQEAETETTETTDEQRVEQESTAFRSWMLDGLGGMPPEQRAIFSRIQNEHRDSTPLTTGTTASGGATVPTSFRKSLTDALLAYGGIFEVADVMQTSTGETLYLPGADDTGNTGAQVSESTQITDEAIPTFVQATLGSYMYHSKIVRVPIQLIRDSAFNIESYISKKLAERLWRIFNTDCTTGAGTTGPKGITVAATNGKTAASATAFDFDEILDLIHSVDPEYRKQGARMTFNDTTLLALRKLKDGDGNCAWQAGYTVGAPDSIHGVPYTINTAMPSASAATKPIVYGALKSFKVRLVGSPQLVRFGEKYMDYLQIGFLAYMAIDSDLEDAGTHPVKCMTMAAG